MPSEKQPAESLSLPRTSARLTLESVALVGWYKSSAAGKEASHGGATSQCSKHLNSFASCASMNGITTASDCASRGVASPGTVKCVEHCATLPGAVAEPGGVAAHWPGRQSRDFRESLRSKHGGSLQAPGDKSANQRPGEYQTRFVPSRCATTRCFVHLGHALSPPGMKHDSARLARQSGFQLKFFKETNM
eukprot:scaffold94716_cov75-Phaeocystis_antarctica.AAC.2